MPLLAFIVLTALGSGLWNTFLIGAGYLLGTQYHALEDYLKYLDYLVIGAIVLFVGWYLVRWYRKHHRRAGVPPDPSTR
jgi:membrane protein DedA with SNARE-associated domain